MRRITYLTISAFALCCMLLWIPAAPARPPVHMQQTSSTGTQQAATVPPVFVKMTEPIDSTHDPAGKVYRGGVMRPVNIGNGVIIAQGSPATVVLVRHGSVLDVQLTSLVIRGKVTPVTSKPGVLTGAAAEPGMAATANRAYARLGRFMKPGTHPPSTFVKMGRQVVLMQGLRLSFVLDPVPVVHPAVPASSPVRPAAAPVAQRSAPPASAQKEGVYLCNFNYRALSGGSKGVNYEYESALFYAPALPIRTGAVRTAWTDYALDQIMKTLGNHWVPAVAGGDCRTVMNEALGQRTIQQQDQNFKSEGQKIVHTGWKYVPGQDKRLLSFASTSASSAPVACGGDKPLYCYAINKNKDVYFTATLEAPPNAGLLIIDFANFLTEKYGLPDGSWEETVLCSRDNNPKNVVKPGYKAVETGWYPKTVEGGVHGAAIMGVCSR